MSVWQDLYRGETKFDFVGQRKKWFTVSAVLLVISILSLLVRGLDGSVDFTGGTIVSAPNESGVDVGEIRTALADIGLEGARVQILGSGEILVQTEALPGDRQDQLVETVAGIAGVDTDATNVDAVGPTFGREITRRAVEALVIFLAVVVVFISWRFEWKMAMGALAALFHDLLITAGIYSVVGFEVTPATVIAILTILGYSLYDTVVVFDKISENVNELGSKHTFSEIANLSMNQVLMRSINTSLTSLLPVGSLLFVGSYLLGATTLREFALALFVGIAAGTYSSIFIATPLLTVWKEREPEWERMRRRAARRAGEPVEASLEPVPAGGRKRRPADAEAVPDLAPETRMDGITPRPPRKRKKRR